MFGVGCTLDGRSLFRCNRKQDCRSNACGFIKLHLRNNSCLEIEQIQLAQAEDTFNMSSFVNGIGKDILTKTKNYAK